MLREFTIKMNGKYRLFIKYVSKLRNRRFKGPEHQVLKIPSNWNSAAIYLNFD